MFEEKVYDHKGQWARARLSECAAHQLVCDSAMRPGKDCLFLILRQYKFSIPLD